MAMSVPKSGLARFLKEGTKYYKGLDEAVEANIEACTELATKMKSAFGPNGMNKMIINHLKKLFVTNDANTILTELDVKHPAAKMVLMACKMQQQEVGDGTNTVMIFAASLLQNAAELLKMGLTPIEVAEGYEMAADKALEIMAEQKCGEVTDFWSEAAVQKAIRTAVMSKQYGNEDILAGLIAKACVSIAPKNPSSFNVDNIRVCKILGSGFLDSQVVNGMVLKRNVEGELNRMFQAKIAIYSCPFDITQTETKGTVLINTAQELLDFSKGEEAEVEKQVKAISDQGVTCVVSGGKFGDLYLHFLNRLGIMAVRVTSKFELRRIARSVGAQPQTRIVPPAREAIGFCDEIYVDEIGDTQVTIFKQTSETGRISTIVIRGSSDNLMDDMERSVNDGVNTYKALTKDGRLVAGGGAFEIELARQMESFGEKCAGMEQYAIKKFAHSLEALAKQLIDNSGTKSTELLSKLYALHQDGKQKAGFDLETGGVRDDVTEGSEPVLDLYLLKWWAIKLATNAASTVLKVDTIIVAKQAEGPKAKPSKGQDEDDD